MQQVKASRDMNRMITVIKHQGFRIEVDDTQLDWTSLLIIKKSDDTFTIIIEK